MAKNAKGKKSGWTVMVFMAASRDDGLTERAAIRDLREMQRVDPGSINVVVQLDRSWPDGPERYLMGKAKATQLPVEDWKKASKKICHEGLHQSLEDRTSSGNPNILLEFLNDTRKRYPAERYLLVLWGHSFGLGFGRDHGDPLTIRELSAALEGFGGVDLLGANACAMVYAEAVVQLRNSAKYLVASEITMPFSGWPYSAILQKLAANPTMSAAELGQLIVDQFVDSYKGKDVALSLINLVKAKGRALPDAVGAFAAQLHDELENVERSADLVEAFLDSAHGDVRPLIDVADLCANVQRSPKVSPGLRGAAAALAALVAVNNKGLVVKHAADPEFVGLNGLGIFVPAVTSAGDLSRLGLQRSEYGQLALTVDTDAIWANVVFDQLKLALGDIGARLAELINESGAASQDERDGVAQLVTSAGRLFIKIENALDRIDEDLNGTGRGAGANAIGDKRQESVAADTALPFLRLLPDDDGTSHPGDRISAGNGFTPNRDLARSFEVLERTLANAERTLRKVVTNGSVGLGPVSGIGNASGPGPKPGLGSSGPGPKAGLGTDPKPGLLDVDPKPGLLDVDPKPGLADVDPKPGLGVRDLILGNAPAATVDLFGVLASALCNIEDAVTALEVTALSGEPAGNPQRQKDDVRRALANAREQVAGASAATFWVLRHPTLGLGPGSGALTSGGRQYLASLSGFSFQRLRLL